MGLELVNVFSMDIQRGGNSPRGGRFLTSLASLSKSHKSSEAAAHMVDAAR
jgi:hypothetical protein